MGTAPDNKSAPVGAFRPAGLRVVIVEDDATLLLAIEDLVGSMGCDVVGKGHPSCLGPRSRGRGRLRPRHSRREPQRRALDEVADVVIARGLPVVFTTGYSGTGVVARQREWPIVHKPYTQDDLGRGMEAALAKNEP